MKEVTEFKHKLVEYLTKSDKYYDNCENLLKFDSTGSLYDFSFATSIWNYYLSEDNDLDKFKNNILIYATNEKDIDVTLAVQKLIDESQNWTLQISEAKLNDGVCEIRLSRNKVFQMVLARVAHDDFCRHNKVDGKTISLTIDDAHLDEKSFTKFRLEIIKKVLSSLIKLSSYSLVEDNDAASNLLLTTRSNSKNNEDSKKIKIQCGVVIDEMSANSDADNYLKKRQEDMHLIAIHKYGMRVKNDEVCV
jgi:hypothetical protein